MKIGDKVYVHGFIDEIRQDTVIIRNDGGYFGTVPSEVVEKEETLKNLKKPNKSDLISRQETLKGYQSVCEGIACHECRAIDADGTCRLESFINTLPSADRPTGHWLDAREEDPCWYICSECKRMVDDDSNYCPNCGARMESDEE